jgi:hypothetical protein
MGWLWERGTPWICSKAWGCGKAVVAGKITGLLVFAGVIDEFKSRSAISSFMKGDPVRADLGDRENVGGVGEITNKVACIKVILS